MFVYFLTSERWEIQFTKQVDSAFLSNNRAQAPYKCLRYDIELSSSWTSTQRLLCSEAMPWLIRSSDKGAMHSALYSFAGADAAALKPHAAPDKGELIVPDCTGCRQKEDFTLSLSHWPRKQQGTFISEPCPHFPLAPKVVLICFQARHRSQAALQIRLVISSDMMADMVGETGGQRVGSAGYRRSTSA